MAAAAPLVSIIIPFFNPGIALEGAVRSVFAQTYTNWELILLDDGSGDGSFELASRIADARVRVVSDGCNRGLVHRLNQMPELAGGELIARLDGDDLMHTRRLEQQVSFLSQHTDVEVLSTGLATLDISLRVLGVRELAPLDLSPRKVLLHGGIVHASVMARKAWFRAHPYRSEFVRAEDRELWVRTLADTRFGKIPEPLYFYVEVGSTTAAKLLQAYASERMILCQYGRGMIGRVATVVLWLRSLSKSVIVRLLDLTGSLDALPACRVEAEDERYLLQVQEQIALIMKTPVPGWDEGAHE